MAVEFHLNQVAGLNRLGTDQGCEIDHHFRVVNIGHAVMVARARIRAAGESDINHFLSVGHHFEQVFQVLQRVGQHAGARCIGDVTLHQLLVFINRLQC